jgi:hypothetical protein
VRSRHRIVPVTDENIASAGQEFADLAMCNIVAILVDEP